MLLLTAALAHFPTSGPINPALGVMGFPDCRRAHPDLPLDAEAAEVDLICPQRGTPGAIKLAAVGDSITAGVHSSGGNHTYPAQLQLLLDQGQGEGTYAVTNLGACGSMLLRNSSSPYWARPQYTALIAGKWDIVVIMLGTNDAHNDCGAPGSRPGCSSNWSKDCGGVLGNASLDDCRFAADFAALVAVVKTLGTTPAGPQVFVMIPPPLMSANSGWPNFQPVINSLFPKLIPLMKEATAGVQGPIDIFGGMGGVPDWRAKFPPSCTLTSSWQPCKLFCDQQSCDYCHPNDVGYSHLARLVYEGLGF